MVKVYNETLSPKFFRDKKLDSTLRKKLLTIANDFITSVDIDIPEVEDIQLTGSLANYNYNPKSDLDIHILIDFSKIAGDYDVVKTALDGLKFVWNIKHNITLKGHDVELYFQDVNEPHISTGLYSIKNKKWITKPSYDPPDLKDADIIKKFDTYKYAIDKLVELSDRFKSNESKSRQLHDHAKLLFAKIRKMRAEGLSRGGEFSVGNIVFKVLRTTDYIEKLVDLINTSYDNIFIEASMFNPGKVNHRQQHATIRDPAGRKHAKTVPQYLQVYEALPNSFKMMQREGSPKFVMISLKDASTISKHFGITDMATPKGCKKSGVAIGQKPTGQYYLIRTQSNKNNTNYLR